MQSAYTRTDHGELLFSPPPRPQNRITTEWLELLATICVHMEEDVSDVTGSIYVAVPECLGCEINTKLGRCDNT
jgi:hypothetical protein